MTAPFSSSRLSEEVPMPEEAPKFEAWWEQQNVSTGDSDVSPLVWKMIAWNGWLARARLVPSETAQRNAAPQAQGIVPDSGSGCEPAVAAPSLGDKQHELAKWLAAYLDVPGIYPKRWLGLCEAAVEYIAGQLAPSHVGEGKTAKQQFDEHMGTEDCTPLERLRFFCSLAMNGQDWLDVEPFFDALTPSSTAANSTQLQAGVNAYQNWKANVGNTCSSAYGGNLHDLARRMHEAMANAAPQEISAEASSRTDGEASAVKKPGATVSTPYQPGEAETPCGAAPITPSASGERKE
jgi:hypothetical protein